MAFHMINIIIFGTAHAGTNRKDDIFIQRRLVLLHIYWSGARNLYINKAHMALDIFRFAVFLNSKYKTTKKSKYFD